MAGGYPPNTEQYSGAIYNNSGLFKLCCRGVSSVVRRCVHRHTGQELAVKIIEITAEKMTAQQLEEVKTSTLKEIQVLNMVKGHASISTCVVFVCPLRHLS